MEGQQQIRVRINGTFRGVPWQYEDHPDDKGSQFVYMGSEQEVSEYWWSDGNFSCDCNRERFLPDELRKLYSGGCGDQIHIDRIVPLDPKFPTLVLGEDDPKSDWYRSSK